MDKAFILDLISRLETLIRLFAYKDKTAVPVTAARWQLRFEFLFTEKELIKAFGVKSKQDLSKTARKAIEVVARIHKGRDSYGVILAKAEKLSKLLQQKRRNIIETEEREAAMNELTALDPESVIPSDTSAIRCAASELREELRAGCVHLLSEVNALHRRLEREVVTCDDPLMLDGEELARLHERLADLHEEADEAFAAQEKVREPLREECVALQHEIFKIEKRLRLRPTEMAFLPKGFKSLNEEKLEELQASYAQILRHRNRELQQKERKDRINQARRTGYLPTMRKRAAG